MAHLKHKTEEVKRKGARNNVDIVKPVFLTDFTAKLGQCHLCLKKAPPNWQQEE